MSKSPYLPNMVCVMVGQLPFLIKVRPAKKGVRFKREYRHCKAGEEGECGSCANALAGMDAGIGKLCFSLDSRFIAVDKIKKTHKGAYGIGTIYRSNQGKFQKKFDGNKKALLDSEDATGDVILYPYYKPKKKAWTSGPSGGHSGGGKIRNIKDPSSKKGALRRAQRSGFFSGSIMYLDKEDAAV